MIRLPCCFSLACNAINWVARLSQRAADAYIFNSGRVCKSSAFGVQAVHGKPHTQCLREHSKQSSQSQQSAVEAYIHLARVQLIRSVETETPCTKRDDAMSVALTSYTKFRENETEENETEILHDHKVAWGSVRKSGCRQTCVTERSAASKLHHTRGQSNHAQSKSQQQQGKNTNLPRTYRCERNWPDRPFWSCVIRIFSM